jgi:hypothetical protein
MRPTMNATLVASALVLGGLSVVGTPSAQAQAPALPPPAARGASPSYPMSPSNRPAPAPAPAPVPTPAPAPRVSTWQRIAKVWTNIVGEDTGKSVYRKDTGTGRDELPGSKPWGVPLH